ncbi:MAG: tryptophan 7-halogenase [Planctomycetaceae bacterium]
MTTSKSVKQTRTLRLPKRVVVLGNDVVAWMAAAMLAKHFISLQVRTTICPGENSVPPGHETFVSSPSLTALIRNFGADEHDVLKACNGTYRLATQFSDWASEGRDFWQPLGHEEIRMAGLPLFDIWAAERIAGRLLRPLHSYTAHWTASLAGKAPHSFSGTSPLAASGQYGFHGEAAGLAGWFRATALSLGVEEICGPLDQTFVNGRGGLAQVKLTSGQAVPGDLFLECRPALAGDEIEDLSDRFLFDRRVFFRTPGARRIHPFTRVTAHDAGWSRTVPLAAEVEHSYDFCSRFQTDDDAGKYLRSVVDGRLDSPLDSAPELHFADVRHFLRRVIWKDNVLHLGRSAQQLEPLAANDMHLDLAGIELLLELVPDRSIARSTRDEYLKRNTAVRQDAVRELLLHHALLNRSDAQTCATIAEAARTDEVQQLLDVYESTGVVRIHAPESTPADHLRSLLAGCHRMPQRPVMAIRSLETGRLQQALRDLVQHHEATVKDLPLHEELLDWIHSGPFQKQAG